MLLLQETQWTSHQQALGESGSLAPPGKWGGGVLSSGEVLPPPATRAVRVPVPAAGIAGGSERLLHFGLGFRPFPFAPTCISFSLQTH